MTFLDLPWHSMKFYDRLWFSMTFYHLVGPLLPSIVKTWSIIRASQITAQIDSHWIPRLDPIDSRSSNLLITFVTNIALHCEGEVIYYLTGTENMQQGVLDIRAELLLLFKNTSILKFSIFYSNLYYFLSLNSKARVKRILNNEYNSSGSISFSLKESESQP